MVRGSGHRVDDPAHGRVSSNTTGVKGLMLTHFRLAGASISAQQATAPAPGGSLASAPAPGTPGDYTLTSGQYTFTVTPNISIGSYADGAQSYVSRSNGTFASVLTLPVKLPARPEVLLMTHL